MALYFECRINTLSNDSLGYFDRLAALNQLNMMSNQIYFDLHNLGNHKYVAHQTALLYVSIHIVLYIMSYISDGRR